MASVQSMDEPASASSRRGMDRDLSAPDTPLQVKQALSVWVPCLAHTLQLRPCNNGRRQASPLLAAVWFSRDPVSLCSFARLWDSLSHEPSGWTDVKTCLVLSCAAFQPSQTHACEGRMIVAATDIADSTVYARTNCIT